MPFLVRKGGCEWNVKGGRKGGWIGFRLEHLTTREKKTKKIIFKTISF
jgi:hypothetical protein